MTIRRYQSKDAGPLAELYVRSVREIGRLDYSSRQIDAWASIAPTPQRLDDLIADGRVRLVAVDPFDRPVAFADLEQDGHIHLLYCAPEMAGKGVSSAVYDEIERLARASGITRLYSEASEAARRFFLKKGFSVEAKREFEISGIPIHNYAVEKILGGRDVSEFSALMLDEADGKVKASIRNLADADLPAGDVTIRIDYSTLNYKDGMILNGLGRLVRQYPHVPGIDFAGTVESSDNPAWKPGGKVILTGWRVGEVHWGGFAQKARVKGEWLVPLPTGLTARQAMAVGTAGLTAMLAVMALEEHGLSPDTQGEVLVTGAAGGLGGVAVTLLARRGYKVAASTGRASEHDYLKSLGASVIVDRGELSGGAAKPLLAERWAGCIDSVGGATLASVLATLKLHAAVASCGNAGGFELNTTVLPFLLRGINLLGIDSAQCPTPRRLAAWDRLAREMPFDVLDTMTTDITLADLPQWAGKILKGEVRGRVVVDVNR